MKYEIIFSDMKIRNTNCHKFRKWFSLLKGVGIFPSFYYIFYKAFIIQLCLLSLRSLFKIKIQKQNVTLLTHISTTSMYFVKQEFIIEYSKIPNDDPCNTLSVLVNYGKDSNCQKILGQSCPQSFCYNHVILVWCVV